LTPLGVEYPANFVSKKELILDS